MIFLVLIILLLLLLQSTHGYIINSVIIIINIVSIINVIYIKTLHIRSRQITLVTNCFFKLFASISSGGFLVILRT
jgi:hypothetical protein